MQTLRIPEPTWRALGEHLRGEHEQVAFLLAREWADGLAVFEMRCPTGSEVAGGRDHIALRDATGADLIAWAWRARASLIEAHSHPHGDPAAFSPTDLDGFTAWVPQVHWRLQERPYLALVCAEHSFDALAWRSPERPEPLQQLIIGSKVVYPTGISCYQLTPGEIRAPRR
jgi:hypothetical protein